MLRIKRRRGERIIVGGEVVIEVLEARGGSVRLGIDAPRSVPVYREEIWVKIKRENGPAVRCQQRLRRLPEALAADQDPAPSAP